ncbi:MAG: hypothetical protein HWD61_15920 [Parachlamydiaceae bacterium]|nr:MAG: hypothetical protein HWD61_15920 [Parachlamydiaceae bacterium]
MIDIVEDMEEQAVKTDLQNIFKGESFKLKAKDELSVGLWIGILKFILDSAAESILIPNN